MTDRDVKKRLIAQRLLEQEAESPPRGGGRLSFQQMQHLQIQKSRADRLRAFQQQGEAARQNSAVAETIRKSMPQQIPFSSLRQPPSSPAVIARPLLQQQQQQQATRNPLSRPIQTSNLIAFRNDDDDDDDFDDKPTPLSRRELADIAASKRSTTPPSAVTYSGTTTATTTTPPRAIEKVYAPVGHSSWNNPAVMIRVYSYLYNTIDSLGVQMDAGLWLKVYGEPPYRNRQLNWSSIADARQMQFVPRYQVAPASASSSTRRTDAYDFYDNSALVVASVGMKRPFDFASSTAAFVAPPRVACFEQNNGFFDPPQTMYDHALRRSFAMQHDGFLCAIHSLNNVSNRMAFAPPDTLGVIDMLRPLGNCYAQLEEVIVAALREGIFLVQIRLTSASDLIPLHDDSEFPANKTCLRLLKRAGGMLVFQPPGHFVSLVYSEEPGVAPSQCWGVYDSRAVVARGPTAATTLDNFIFRRNIAGISDQRAIARELAKRQAKQRSDFDTLYIGLLPISLEALLDDGIGDDPSSGGDSSSDQDAVYQRLLEKRLIRSLLRRSLSETMVIKSLLIAQSESNQQEYEINVPLPLQPSAIDSIVRDIDSNDLTGSEQTNPASLYATRFSIDQSLNDIFDELAAPVLQYFLGGKTLFWRRQLADTLNRARGVLDSAPGSGLFFTSVAQNEQSLRQFLRLHSNRRWFRYFVLYICCSSIVDYIGTKPEIPIPPGTPESRNPRKNPENDRWYLKTIPSQIFPLLILVCMVGYTNLTTLGNPDERTPNIGRLFDYLYNERERSLLLPPVPQHLAAIAARPTSTENAAAFKAYFSCNRYDKTFWLLEATATVQLPEQPQLGLPAFPLPSIEPFRLTLQARRRVGEFYSMRSGEHEDFDLERFYGASCDDLSFQYDDMAEFVLLLRTTLFRLPLAGQDFNAVGAVLASVEVTAPTPLVLAQHMHEVADEFIARATTPVDSDTMPFADINSDEMARRWVDIVAFDRAYSSNNWRNAAQVTQFHATSLQKPRLFERVLQTGFDSIHRTVFGIQTLAPDTRRAIYTNQTRVPIVDSASRPVQRWDDVRPYTSQRAQLSMRPIGSSAASSATAIPTSSQTNRNIFRYPS